MIQKLKTIGLHVATLALLAVPLAGVAAQPAYAQEKVGPVKAGEECKAPYQQLNANNCKIVGWILLITNALSGMVSIIIAGSLVYAGIQYASAGADPQKVMAARKRIRDSIIALLFFIFAWAFLQWLIPGGIV
ncbi:hypothetical protein CR970_01105 [Candidatus Saccharibacteria bacterium]|nr:MAG: hypothetical protein CR970_01105 [Candidatus Saccharibacteria bacterium]